MFELLIEVLIIAAILMVILEVVRVPRWGESTGMPLDRIVYMLIALIIMFFFLRKLLTVAWD
jgi:hypothetical protein